MDFIFAFILAMDHITCGRLTDVCGQLFIERRRYAFKLQNIKIDGATDVADAYKA